MGLWKKNQIDPEKDEGRYVEKCFNKGQTKGLISINMKRFLLIFGLVLCFNNTFGHTGYSDTLKCPVCSNSVVFQLTMSMTTFGGYLDFQKKGAIGYYYEEMINSCHTCYFSGYHSDFDTTYRESYIDSVKIVTEKYKGKSIDDALECEIAAEIKMLTRYEYDAIATIYLDASYFLRFDSLQTERRIGFQLKTAELLSKAIENNEYEKDAIATINYLMGEMYRRAGQFDKAVLYFDLAINDKKKQDWIKDVATKQKILAKNEDDNNGI